MGGVRNLEERGQGTSLEGNEKGMVYLNGLDAFGRIFCLCTGRFASGLCSAVSNAESGTECAVWAGFSVGGSEYAEPFGGTNQGRAKIGVA